MTSKDLQGLQRLNALAQMWAQTGALDFYFQDLPRRYYSRARECSRAFEGHAKSKDPLRCKVRAAASGRAGPMHLNGELQTARRWHTRVTDARGFCLAVFEGTAALKSATVPHQNRQRRSLETYPNMAMATARRQQRQGYSVGTGEDQRSPDEPSCKEGTGSSWSLETL